MLKILWILVATHSVDGFQFHENLEGSYDTVGECVQASHEAPTKPNVIYSCTRTYNGKQWNSQPSWMTDEQAEMLIDRQDSLRK